MIVLKLYHSIVYIVYIGSCKVDISDQVFLRRIDNNIRLRGDWRNLVGDLSSDFWIGFSNIKKLISSRQNRHFRFDMRAAAKSPAHAVYENVHFDGAQFQMLYDKFADTLSNTGE